MIRTCILTTPLAALLSLAVVSCGKKEARTASGESMVTINGKGSDTMIQLVTALAENYRDEAPHVQVNTSGGGSGTGIAALQNGTVDLAFASREMKPEEMEKVKAATGKEAVEHAIAYDALAIYTHPKNPLKEISMPELGEMWAEGGSITNWNQLVPEFSGDIVLVGRQNNSGTYDYFREHILGKTADGKQREFRKGISELNGSAEVVENVAKTPTAVGYSGMGFKNDSVKWMAVAKEKGGKAVLPGIEEARTGEYPIARKLYIYTAGEAEGAVKEFIDWITGPEGQAIVAKQDFVPLQ